MIKECLENEDNKEIFEQWQNISRYVNLLKRAVKVHNLRNNNVEQLFEDISIEMDMIAMTGFESGNLDVETRFNRICRDILIITNSMAFNSHEGR